MSLDGDVGRHVLDNIMILVSPERSDQLRAMRNRFVATGTKPYLDNAESNFRGMAG